MTSDFSKYFLAWFRRGSRSHPLDVLLNSRSEYKDLIKLIHNSPDIIAPSDLAIITDLSRKIILAIESHFEKEDFVKSNQEQFILDTFRGIASIQHNDQKWFSDRILLISHILDRLNLDWLKSTRTILSPPEWPNSPRKRGIELSTVFQWICVFGAILAIMTFIYLPLVQTRKDIEIINEKIPDITKNMSHFADAKELIAKSNARLAWIEERLGAIDAKENNKSVSLYGKLSWVADERPTLPGCSKRFNPNDLIITLNIPKNGFDTVYSFLIGREVYISQYSSTLSYRKDGIKAKIECISVDDAINIPSSSAKTRLPRQIPYFPDIGLTTSAVFKSLSFPDPVAKGKIDVEIVLSCPDSITEIILQWNSSKKAAVR